MEPFGLFDFLHTLLPNSANENGNTTSPATDNEAPPAAAPEEPITTESDKKKAVIGFLDAHERRARNLRK